MTVEHVRMDNRLIHGQVLVAWDLEFDIDHIIVANDEVARDALQITLLKAVAPLNARVSVMTIEEAAAYVRGPAAQDEDIFIIAKYPQDGLALVKEGLEVEVLNLGNQAFTKGAKRLTNSVYLTEAGVKALQELHERGIKLTCRMMPGDSTKECWPTIEKNFPEWTS
jgi:mannose/fructose/N-acetylgalactosamine-specific phosphotransferase system component IIB